MFETWWSPTLCTVQILCLRHGDHQLCVLYRYDVWDMVINNSVFCTDIMFETWWSPTLCTVQISCLRHGDQQLCVLYRYGTDTGRIHTVWSNFTLYSPIVTQLIFSNLAFNTLASMQGSCMCDFTNTIWWMINWIVSLKLLLGKFQQASLVTSRHWFRYWLGAVGQRAIT